MFRSLLPLALPAVVVCLAACQRTEDGKQASTSQTQGAPPMSVNVTSSAFAAGQPIPRKYTGQGEDISPPLAWSNVPSGTKELALICDDPDAPRAQPWVHWVLAKIPAGTSALEEGASSAKAGKSPPGMAEGKNDFGTIGYQGPMPPPGKAHRYYFRLYALDVALTAGDVADKPTLLAAMKGHILATGELMGTYQRR
jgi:hypothetical protein